MWKYNLVLKVSNLAKENIKPTSPFHMIARPAAPKDPDHTSMASLQPARKKERLTPRLVLNLLANEPNTGL